MTDAAPDRYRLVAIIVASAMLMEQLDGTVLATALPTMARGFHTSPLSMNVAMTSYLLSLAVFIPASGRFADKFGSRTVFRAAIGLFTLGSALCGAAGSVPFLILSRIIQGIGGSMMVPVGRLVLIRVTPKSELINAMAWMLIPSTIGSVLGAPLGGLVVTYLSWRWIFYINLPIGVLGMVLVSKFIDQVRMDGNPRIDLTGMALSGISLCCLTFGLESASRGLGGEAEWIILLFVGLVSGLLYTRHARRQRDPILDFRLMRINTFAISVLSGSLYRIAIGAVPFLLPMMLQLGFGLSAARSGAITFATAAGTLAMRMFAKTILRRFGYRTAMAVNGTISMLLFAAEAAMRPSWPALCIYALLFTVGFMQSLQFTAYNTIAYADVPPSRVSAATSFYNTFQQIALSLGITVSAMTLSAILAITGRPGGVPSLGDFSLAFLVVATIGIMAAPSALRLASNAGAEMSGHRIEAKTIAQEAADASV